MATAAQIRTQIQSKIFTPYGKTVVLHTQGATTYDERGDIASFVASTSNITIVPYDVSKDKLMFERFADYKPGDMFAAVPYTVTVNIHDRIVMEGDTWDIQEIVPHYLPDNLVTVIRMAKIVA